MRAVTNEDVAAVAATLFCAERLLSAAGIGPREARFRAAVGQVNPLAERA